MPGLNRRGPNGEGAMTGRKLGHCNPDNKGKSDAEILQGSVFSLQRGQGMGCGPRKACGNGQSLGLGRGMGFRFRGNR